MGEDGLLYAPLTEAVIGGAIEVHRQLGPGMMESTYEACLAYELAQAGLSVRCQVELPVVYKGQRLECGYRIDMIVEDKVLLELKVVDKVLPVHESQMFTYLRLSGMRVGLLINFHVTVLKNGITRRIL